MLFINRFYLFTGIIDFCIEDTPTDSPFPNFGED